MQREHRPGNKQHGPVGTAPGPERCCGHHSQRRPRREHRTSTAPPGRRQPSFGRAEGKSRWCRGGTGEGLHGATAPYQRGREPGLGHPNKPRAGSPAETVWKRSNFSRSAARGLSPPRSEARGGHAARGHRTAATGEEQSHSSPSGPPRLPARSAAICRAAANYECPRHPRARWRGRLTAELTHLVTLHRLAPTEPGERKLFPPPLRTLSRRGAARPGRRRCRQPAQGLRLHQTPSEIPRAEAARAGSAGWQPAARGRGRQRGTAPPRTHRRPKTKAQLFRNSRLPRRDLRFAFWPLFFPSDR